MTSTTNPTHDAIRKAAILVSSMDQVTAYALLQQLSEDERCQLLEVVQNLEPVDQQERQEIVRQFLLEGRRHPESSLRETDELALTGLQFDEPRSAEEPQGWRCGPGSTTDPQASSMSFRRIVDTIPVEMLMDALRHEHPQVMAVVVTRMSPDRAALLLAGLETHLQVEVARRVAELGPADPEALADIELEIVQRLTEQVQRVSVAHRGKTSLQMILTAADTDCREELLRNIQREDARLAARLGLIRGSDANPCLPKATSGPGQTGSVRMCFEQLGELEDSRLSHLFDAVDVEIAALALALTDRGMVRRVLALLPSERAGEIERQIATLVPLRVSDIDMAQQAILELAQERFADCS